MQKVFLTLIAALLIHVFATAQTTYYISSSEGNNINTGKSSSSPWKTISKLNSTSFKAGDRILFKNGDIWRESLDISSSGTSTARIEFSSYGTGNKPVISGANLIASFTVYSGNIWKAALSSHPQQVFINGVRAAKQSSAANVNSNSKWFWSSGYLYIYAPSNPATYYKYPGVEYTARSWSIITKGDYLTIEGLQLEKTTGSALRIASTSLGVTADNLDFFQWSVLVDGQQGAVNIDGSYTEIKNCTFGKKTGSDIADQHWAGFMGIAVRGKQNSINNNKIYHTAIENESSNGKYAFGIHLVSVTGITHVSGNYIYHTGSHGIYVASNTRSGEAIHIKNNTIEYPGMAGISAYKTRSEDGVGGKGYVYGNKVSYANRLGGDVGGGGMQASGIHFNDGLKSGLESGKPYMKWYCYENVVHNSQALKLPNSPDANGISIDYNANGVEVYRNLLYNNYGKGMEIWNSNKCKIYYNVMYGNDAGMSVTALRGGIETANDNEIYNNTFFQNYNGDAKGTNLNAEIFFGFNGKYNIFKNNILYALSPGYAYVYNVENTTGIILDHNIVFSNRSIVAKDGRYGEQTFAQWKSHYSTWDRNSLNTDPQLNNISSKDFNLKSSSPAINKGAILGLLSDFMGNTLIGAPDIGACEYGSTNSTPPSNEVILLNAMSGSFSGDARLGTMTGSKNSRVVYFQGTNGGVSFNVNIPKSGTWYAWARMYYKSSGGKNSFLISAKGVKFILGDDDNKYDQWHWDGYKGSKANIGDLSSGSNTIIISGREPGLTLWIDQIILTDDPDYTPPEFVNSSPGTNNSTMLLNAMNGTFSGDARLGSMTGSKNSRVVYFQGTNGGVSFTVNIPQTGTWYAWARMYYKSSGGKNSFLISNPNGVKFILGDDDTKYDKWHWDGYQGSKTNLGTLSAGNNNIMVSGREPGLTLWIDQIILTNDPNYIPSDAAASKTNPTLIVKPILLNAYAGSFSGDARLGSMSGSKNSRVVYFKGTNGGVTFNVNLPKSGTWYAWARMYYNSSGGKNSFLITNTKGIKFILGDDDNSYNKWYWDGYKGSKANLGELSAGSNSITISGREPGLTLWIDQIVLTDDPDYNPNSDLQKEGDTTEPAMENILPFEFELSQNYPNPFNPSTTINYSVPEISHITLKIFDVLGAEVASLVDEVKSPGYYEAKFDAHNLASGIYIYQIRTKEFVSTKKMNLLK